MTSSKNLLFGLYTLAPFLSALMAYLLIMFISEQCDKNTIICKIIEPWTLLVIIIAWIWLPIIFMRNRAISVVKKIWMIVWSLIVTGAAIVIGIAHSYVLFN
jgi:hypothetical protein